MLQLFPPSFLCLFLCFYLFSTPTLVAVDTSDARFRPICDSDSGSDSRLTQKSDSNSDSDSNQFSIDSTPCWYSWFRFQFQFQQKNGIIPESIPIPELESCITGWHCQSSFRIHCNSWIWFELILPILVSLLKAQTSSRSLQSHILSYWDLNFLTFWDWYRFTFPPYMEWCWGWDR